MDLLRQIENAEIPQKAQTNTPAKELSTISLAVRALMSPAMLRDAPVNRQRKLVVKSNVLSGTTHQTSVLLLRRNDLIYADISFLSSIVAAKQAAYGYLFGGDKYLGFKNKCAALIRQKRD